MNPFAVEWEPDAADELADIYLRALDRRAVTAAQARIDHLLSRNPHGNGCYLAEDLWQIDNFPLAVNYTIDDVLHEVWVTWVRLLP